MNNEKILIVEDELILAMEMEMKLQDRGFNNIKIISTGEEAIDLAESYKPNLVIMDIMLKGKINGIEAASQILTFQKIHLIYVTGNSHLKEDTKLVATNPIDILSKPLSDWELFNTINKALKTNKKSGKK
jgi:two-component system, response regulator PdtaR